MVPYGHNQLEQAGLEHSEILSRSLVTRLRISPALFWSKKRRAGG